MPTEWFGDNAFQGWIGSLLGAIIGAAIGAGAAVWVMSRTLERQREDGRIAARHERLIAAAADWAGAILRLPPAAAERSRSQYLVAQFEVPPPLQRLLMELGGRHDEFCEGIKSLSAYLVDAHERVILSSGRRILSEDGKAKLEELATESGHAVTLVTTWVAQPDRRVELLAELQDFVSKQQQATAATP